jgi:N-methylhydantoinase A
MRIDRGCGDRALAALADERGRDALRGAYGVHDIVNENMAGAARVALAERGRVPQDYALLATGGAGPVHAWQVARKLGVKRLVCPPGAGAGSTIGMLKAPARVDRVTSFNVALRAADFSAAEKLFATLKTQALAIVAATGADLAGRQVRRLADMRYVGQGSEITVELPAELDSAGTLRAFETAYRALFGRTPPGAAAQIVALRLSLTAPMPGAAGMLRFATQHPGRNPIKGRRTIYFHDAGGYIETDVYDRYALAPGSRLRGPAVFEENESTFVVGPDSAVEILHNGTILVDMPTNR